MLKNREGWLVSDTHRECTECRAIFEKKSRMTLCPVCNTARVKARTTQQKMFARAKSRALAKNLEFNLELEDIIIPEICPIMGVPLAVQSGRSGAYTLSPSVDRIDNAKGYIKGNVWVISQMANAMKGAATPDEMIKFAKWILSTYN